VAANITTLSANETTLAANETTLAANITTLAANTTTLAANETTLASNTTTLAVNTTTLAANATTVAALVNVELVALQEEETALQSNLTTQKLRLEEEIVLRDARNETVSVIATVEKKIDLLISNIATNSSRVRRAEAVSCQDFRADVTAFMSLKYSDLTASELQKAISDGKALSESTVEECTDEEKTKLIDAKSSLLSERANLQDVVVEQTEKTIATLKSIVDDITEDLTNVQGKIAAITTPPPAMTTTPTSFCCKIKTVRSKGADYDGDYTLKYEEAQTSNDGCKDACVYYRDGNVDDLYCFRSVSNAELGSAIVQCEDQPSPFSTYMYSPATTPA